MKLKNIAIAALSFCAFSSFAAAPDTSKCTLPATPTAGNLQDFTNNCAPEATLFIAGSSALGGSVNSTIINYFKPGTITQIMDAGTPNGLLNNPTNGNKPGNGVVALYGIGHDTKGGNAGKRLFIVYNSYFGSAAGVSNLMAGDKLLANVPEADVVKVGPVTTGKGAKAVTNANLCSFADQTSYPKINAAVGAVVSCTSHAVTRADIALSDVRADELVGMYDVTKGGPALTAINSVPFAMQGFGIAVNNKLYVAMQEAQGLKTASACQSTTATSTATPPVTTITPDLTAACQPSISKALYASLVTKDGNIKSAAALLQAMKVPTGVDFSTDATKLVVARRDQLSGTQATSDIFFGNAICNALDSSAKVNKHGGAMVIARPVAGNYPTTSSIEFQENVQTSSVEAALANTSDYVIGVLALSKMSSTAYSFVKLDNVSPYVHSATTGVRVHSNTNSRAKMISGEWPLQVVSYAMSLKTAVASAAPKKALIEGIIEDLRAPTNDLKGIGYFTGDEYKQTKVSRKDGNNCSPLLFLNNQ